MTILDNERLIRIDLYGIVTVTPYRHAGTTRVKLAPDETRAPLIAELTFANSFAENNDRNTNPLLLNALVP